MPAKKKIHEFTVVDLFSGCGGITHGLHQVATKGHRFRTVVAVDIWKSACETMRVNHPGIEVINDGLSTAIIKRISEDNGRAGVDLVVGGPPCQGFSTSGKRALDDPRNSLVRMYFEAIKALQPKAFLMENVVGFTTFQDQKILHGVLTRAKKLGYKVYPAIIQASLYGVPQRRRRFVLVGVQCEDFAWPDFVDAQNGKKINGSLCSHWLSGLSSDAVFVQEIPDDFRELTFNEATLDLPALKSGESKTRYKNFNSSNWFLDYVKKDSDQHGLTGHVSPNHAKHLVAMMQELKQGQSAFDAFEEGHELRPTSGFSNSYTRIRSNLPAPTITRNFTTPSSANCIHPTDARALTPREGARMQSFPDSYMFCGSSTEQRLLIGNAVPPLLARALGESLIKNLIDQMK